jgi:hypothetical protein
MTELFTPVLEFLQSQSWYNIAASVVALASAIAASTATPNPNSKFAWIYKVIDFLALNVGKAKDKGV